MSEKKYLEHRINNLVDDNEWLKIKLETALQSTRKAKSEIKTIVQ